MPPLMSRRLARVALCALSLLLPAYPARAQDLVSGAGYTPRLEKILYQNIAPFWHPRALDLAHGGYRVDFSGTGEPKPGGTKMIVSQARMVWYFAHMARTGLGGSEYLEAAEHGFRFLHDRMWDAAHGGFFWELDSTGKKVVQSRKHLYGQAFGLYAVSEYFLASGRKEARDFAERIFGVMEARAHDKEYGGYVEFFNADWTPVPASEYSPIGEGASLKLMNTHLHLLEALTTYYRATEQPLARERLLELIEIQSSTVVRKNLGACTDAYQRDWTPHPDPKYARVSYGHDLENVWLLLDACKAAGISYHPLTDLFRTLWDYALTYGFDEENGGFFYTGAFNKPADVRDKSWWVQGEALVSALYMYRLTQDERYRRAFDKTLDWIERHQVDWKGGEWHGTVTPDGKTPDDKGNAWKAAYHSGRTMMECLQLLSYKPRRP